MNSTPRELTDNEMLHYYMHKVNTNDSEHDKKMNNIFYKNSTKYKLDTDTDSNFCTIDSTPITANKKNTTTNCLFCFPVRWSKIFDVNDK
jgi:hypothetical protein